jgi:prepilin-type N-terminal cleavage/methylation domain-containing protein
MKRCKGFTLIELLIVVAIIAILAAIAVPNFLEAQTRAKISRVKADQRTLATAIESYSVDWNEEPIGFVEIPKFDGNSWPTRWGTQTQSYFRCYANMTTPVAYTTSIPFDPFGSQGVFRQDMKLMNDDIYKLYRYQSILEFARGGTRSPLGDDNGRVRNNGINWCLWSFGPTRCWSAPAAPGYSGHPSYGRHQINPIKYLAKIPSFLGTQQQIGYPDAVYDPTNGTLSYGIIMRSSQGVH